MKLLTDKVSSDSDLSRRERETTILITDEGVKIHSDHSTGIKWCVQQIKEGNANLEHQRVKDNELVGIIITTNYNLVSFKSIPRKQNNISNIFSIPKEGK